MLIDGFLEFGNPCGRNRKRSKENDGGSGCTPSAMKDIHEEFQYRRVVGDVARDVVAVVVIDVHCFFTNHVNT